MATRRRICRIRVLAENSPFLASASTRQKGHFQKYARLARLAAIHQTIYRGLARLADIHQPILVGLDTFVDIRQPTLPGLDTFTGLGDCIECIESVESSKFCIFLGRVV